MNDKQETPQNVELEQVVSELAKRDASDASHPTSAAEDSTLRDLKAELDTLASELREPPPIDEFEDESDCRRVTELVERIGREPTFSTQNVLGEAQGEQLDLGQIGPYQFLEKLGQGGMGAVYKALHTKLKRVVAIKVLPVERMKQMGAIARFEREMEAVGSLQHPNIVAAHDAGEANDMHYLVMEFVDGLDLSELIHRVGPLRAADACEIARQAAVGLQEAHLRNMVHRDIKPSNLMLASPGHGSQPPLVKILDLGLALLDDRRAERRELTSTGQMMGTLDYMAPEQGDDSHDVDIRADIYSLGATLYKLLCGEVPFSGDKYRTPIKLLTALATQDVPSIATKRDDLPAGLVGVVDRMLARQPADRFGTPAEVAAALAPLVSDADLSSLLDRADSAELPATEDQSSCGTREHITADSKETEPSIEELPPSYPAEPLQAEKLTTVDYQPDHLAAASTDPRPARTQPSRTWNRTTKIIATLAGIAAMFAAITTIVIQSDRGDIKVVSYDPDIEVTIRRNGEVIDGFEVKQRPDATSYYSGEFEIELKGGNPDGTTIKNGRFTLTRGKTELVTITREEKLAAKPVPPIAKAPFDAAEAKEHQKTWAQHLGIPAERDIDLPGGEKLTLVLIPPGEFLMGSTDEEQARLLEEAKAASDVCAIDRIPSEGPQHRVRITRPFYLGKYEVTHAQWQAVMGSNPSAVKDSPSHPVEQVNWNDIQPFLTKLNERASAEEMKFALPTEAQWEYACRAGTTTFWHCGDSQPAFHEYAWFKVNSGGKTHPVGQLRPNGFGLYDMHGNAWEWCADWFAADYYAKAPVDDPSDAPIGSLRVRRGGSWNAPQRNCRSAFRHDSSPGNRDLGFRLAIPISDQRIELLKNDPLAADPQVVAPQVAKWQLGPAEDVLPGLIPRPANLPGIKRWQVETDYPRGIIPYPHYSPDGKWLALGSGVGHVHIYDVETMKIEMILVGHANAVANLAWSPDGSRIATVALLEPVRIWDVASGRTVRQLSNELPPDYWYYKTLAWHPDSRKLAFGVGGKFTIWDVESDVPLTQVQADQQSCHVVTWSPDGKWIATGGRDHNVRIWNAVDGTAGTVLKGHTAAIASIAWRPDSKQVASGSETGEGAIRIWNIDKSEPVQLLHRPDGGTYRFQSVAWSPDGASLAAVSGGQFFTWNMTKESDGVLLGGVYHDSTVDWHPNGRHLAIDGVQLWDLETKKSRIFFSRTGVRAAWSPDGTTLAVGVQDGTVRLLDPETGTQRRILRRILYRNEAVSDVAWSHDGRQLATAGGSVKLWNPSNGNLVKTLGDGGDWLAVSPDGKHIAKTLRTDGVEIWNMEDGTKTETLRGSESFHRCVDWSPDGKRVAAGCDDGTVHVWNRDNDNRHIVLDNSGQVVSVAWSPDGKWLATGYGQNQTVGVWDAQRLSSDAKPQHRFRVGSFRSALAWSTDSRWLASTGTDETDRSAVFLWDATTQQVAKVFGGHPTGITDVSFDSGQGHLATSGNDGTVRIWDIESQKLERLNLVLPDAQLATFTPAGELLQKTDSAVDHLVYLIDDLSGCRHLLKPSEFNDFVDSSKPFDQWRSPPTLVDEQWQPGPEADVLPGLIPRPAKFDGIKRWQVEAVAPRDTIDAIAYSPQGDRLACAGGDRQVRVYDTASGQLKQLFVGGQVARVLSVAWHPSGRVLASGETIGNANGPAIKLWDVENGAPVGELFGHRLDVSSLAWSPNGEVIASGSHDGTVRLWDFERKAEAKILGDTKIPIRMVAWSPDGSRLAAISHDKLIWIWDLAGGESITAGTAERPTWPLDNTPLIAWSPNGKQIAMGGAGEFTIFNAADGTLARKGGEPGVVGMALAWMNEGRELAVRAPGNFSMKIFSAKDGQEISRLGSPASGTALFMTLSSTGDQMAAVFGRGEINLISMPDFHRQHRIYAGNRSNSVFALSSNGESIATQDASEIRLHHAVNGSPEKSLSGLSAYGGYGFAWHPYDSRLACVEYKELIVIDTQTGEIVRKPSPTGVRGIAWSPDGKRLAAGIGNEIHLWDETLGEPIRVLNDHDAGVTGIAWSPDGNKLAAVRYHTAGPGIAWCWSAETGDLLWTHEEPVDGRANWFGSVAFTDNGKRLLLRGAVTRYVDANTGKADPYLKDVPSGFSVSVSPDGSRFVAGGYYNGLSLHDSESGNKLLQFGGHSLGIYTSAAFSPDGRHIASGNKGDGTLRWWDAETGRLVWMSLQLPDGKSAVFSEAGQLQTRDPEIEDHLVYIVEFEDGTRELFRPSEFQKLINRPSLTLPQTPTAPRP